MSTIHNGSPVSAGRVPNGRRCAFAGLILACALLSASCGEKRAISVTESDISLIPMPERLVRSGGTFTIDRKTAILADAGDAGMKRIGGYLAGIFARAGLDVTVGETAGGSVPKGAVRLTLVTGGSDSLGAEGYRLAVSEDGVTIAAGTHAGVFYGVQTFRQLLPVEFEMPPGRRRISSAAIPCVTVYDRPRFSWRGMHLDVSRHFFPKEFVKRYIDLIAMHRMNVFHWHLVDGAGWRIEIKRYPKLTGVGAWRRDFRDEEWSFTRVRAPEPGGEEPYGGFYTQDDIREIVAYAKERYVTVVPEIEMPGHSGAALAAYPEHLCTDVEPTTLEYENSGVFCAGKDETFAFLEGILDEVLELFPGEYIHVGGDEVPKRYWEACPDCQKRIREEKLADEDELQSWFIRRIETFLVSRGRKLVGWDEILEGGLAPEATVMSWRGMQGGVEAARQRHDVIMSPEPYTYFNHYQGDPDLEPKAWGGFTPLSQVYSFDPVPGELAPDEAAFIIGAQGCVWSEFIQTADMVEYMVLPRMSALAEVLWTDGDLRNWETFKTRMVKQYRRYDALGLNYARSAFNVDFEVDIVPETFDAVISMDSDAAGTDIFFTLDESDPSPAARRYTGPVTLHETATVKAGSFAGGKLAGKVTSTRYRRHKATGKRPRLEHPYNDQYPGSGDFNLTDGLTGSKDYGDGRWQAFLRDDLVAVIDLGGPTAVSGVTVTFFHNPGVWIFMPAGVEAAVSDDGASFRTVASIDNDMPQDTPGPIIREFKLTFDETAARYVKVRAKNIGDIPSWHAGAGSGAFMFADEIVVE